MIRTCRGVAPNPAEDIVSGTVDNSTTWCEDIKLTPLTDDGDQGWTLELYRESGSHADLTLMTADGTLTITEGDISTTLGIRCNSSRLSSLCGDYRCDVKSTDTSSTVDGAARVYLRARGNVTVVGGAS